MTNQVVSHKEWLKRAADLNAGRFAVEVRNKDWLDAGLTDLLARVCYQRN